jgi:hypothetical protein
MKPTVRKTANALLTAMVPHTKSELAAVLREAEMEARFEN